MLDRDRRDFCQKLFKPVFDNYKKNKALGGKSIEKNFEEKYTPDYVLFKKLHNSFTNLEKLIKYAIMIVPEYYKKFKESVNNPINIPYNTNDLLMLYTTYPHAIEFIHEELFDIINIENYELLLILRKINILLYYSTTIDNDIDKKIMLLEEQINLFCEAVNKLTKKLMRSYIEIIVTK